MPVEIPQDQPPDEFGALVGRPVGGPVSVGWREGTLTRAKELETLCGWVLAQQDPDECDILARAVLTHVQAAREAAEAAALKPKKRIHVFRYGPLMERAMSNLYAAEAHLLRFAPARYLLGQMPCLLRHVQSHLVPADPRRQEFERIAGRIGVKDPDRPALPSGADVRDGLSVVKEERGTIVAITRGASSEALREQVRVRSFRNILVITTLAMTLLAAGIAVIGFLNPRMFPMCFAPEEAGQVVVVCPTAQSAPFSPPQPGVSPPASGPGVRDIDNEVRDTVAPHDLLVVELVGLAAAAIAAAAAIRGIRGSSERYGLPVVMAALKLPTGAVTAFLGVLLMRGEFVPGLSALDTSAQILAWALVFGYAQQLFTRLVDRQGQTVLDSVRGADKTAGQS